MVHKLVQSGFPFVYRRGHTYYFRYAFPLRIRRLCPALPAEVKRSLGTDSYSVAVGLVGQKLPLIETLKACRDEAAVMALWRQLVDFSQQLGEWVGQQLARLTAKHGAVQGAIRSVIPKRPNSPRLTKVWSEFVEWKEWTDKRSKENQRMFDTLLHFIGDKPVLRVTREDIKSALRSISKLPVRHKKAYRGLPLDKLEKMTIPDGDRISGKQVKEYLKLAQSLFSAYLVKERGILKESPTTGVEWKAEAVRYASMTDAQVRHVLKGSAASPEWFRWLLRLAVYSGGRREELAKLRRSDFKLCPDTGRHYFVIQEGKTKAARRFVPLHRKLLEAGFLEWLSGIEGQLFPIAANNPNRVTHNFATLLSERESDLGERIVFHSCRHTFITKARAAGVESVLVQQVVGHEKRGAGITDRYTHSFQMQHVLPVVDVVDYGL